jgi:hypothetical protein
MVQRLDNALRGIDAKEEVRPILDALILKVKDPKLATLLNEFNAAKNAQPNLAAIGFRTILCLIIREKAKQDAPNSRLATRDDFAVKDMIEEAVKMKLFDTSNTKLLKGFLDGGAKDVFDNVAHKAGEANLVDKDALSYAVEYRLNNLLKAICQNPANI